jgi:iron(III) transport system permease protein
LNEDGETVYSAAMAGIALIIIVTAEVVVKRFFKVSQ